jgi:predicted O-methyltransferase YrrM
MAFHENWFGKPKQKRLQQALDACKAQHGEVMEVGCWEGRSTIMIANHFHPATVHCVDHWQGDLTNLKSGVAALAAERDVYADFIENMDEATQGNYAVHRMGWRDLAPSWEQKLRFLFIDGEHTYPEVKDNIEWALPFMEPGGVIAGDDGTVSGVWKAVTEMLDDVETRPGPGSAVWWKVV